jgi:hypothetical protein
MFINRVYFKPQNNIFEYLKSKLVAFFICYPGPASGVSLYVKDQVLNNLASTLASGVTSFFAT